MATFIEEKGFNIGQSVPALVSMGLGNIAKSSIDSPLYAMGNAVGTLVQAYHDNKNQVKLVELQTKMQEQENAFNMNIRSTPNIMDTEDGRNTFKNSYNDYLERQKELINSYRKEIGDTNYLNITNKFKASTSNDAFTLQTALNQKFLHEKNEELVYATDVLSESMSQIDPNDVNAYAENVNKMSEILKVANIYGQDTDKFGRSSMDSIEDNYLQNVVYSIMDTEKFKGADGLVNHDLMREEMKLRQAELLDPDRIKSDAKRYQKIIGGDLDTIEQNLINKRSAIFGKNIKKVNGYQQKQNQLKQTELKLNQEKILGEQKKSLNNLNSGKTLSSNTITPSQIVNNNSTDRFMNTDGTLNTSSIGFDTTISKVADNDIDGMIANISKLKYELDNIKSRDDTKGWNEAWLMEATRQYVETQYGINPYENEEVVKDISSIIDAYGAADINKVKGMLQNPELKNKIANAKINDVFKSKVNNLSDNIKLEDIKTDPDWEDLKNQINNDGSNKGKNSIQITPYNESTITYLKNGDMRNVLANKEKLVQMVSLYMDERKNYHPQEFQNLALDIQQYRQAGKSDKEIEIAIKQHINTAIILMLKNEKPTNKKVEEIYNIIPTTIDQYNKSKIMKTRNTEMSKLSSENKNGLAISYAMLVGNTGNLTNDTTAEMMGTNTQKINNEYGSKFEEKTTKGKQISSKPQQNTSSDNLSITQIGTNNQFIGGTQKIISNTINPNMGNNSVIGTTDRGNKKIKATIRKN